MAQRLFETTEDDPTQGLVFPYLSARAAGGYKGNYEKTAKAIVRGLRSIELKANGKLYVPSVDAVRQAIKRFPATH